MAFKDFFTKGSQFRVPGFWATTPNREVSIFFTDASMVLTMGIGEAKIWSVDSGICLHTARIIVGGPFCINHTKSLLATMEAANGSS